LSETNALAYFIAASVTAKKKVFMFCQNFECLKLTNETLKFLQKGSNSFSIKMFLSAYQVDKPNQLPQANVAKHFFFFIADAP
jgi:hypothetical protein